MNHVNIKELLGKGYELLDQEWTRLSKQTDEAVYDNIRRLIREHVPEFEKLGTFQLEMVVDTNVIFSEIKGLLDNGKNLEDSSLIRLLQAKSLKIYAPPLIVVELEEKINLKMGDRVIEGQNMARQFCSLIEIREAYWVENFKKAKSLIGCEDKDDVPFLALALNIGAHGIMSKDSVFELQETVPIWKASDVNRLLVNYNKGLLSLFVAGSTSFIVFQIFSFLASFVRAIIEIIAWIVSGIVAIGAGLLESIPPWLLIVLLGICAVYFINKVSDEELLNSFLEKFDEFKNRIKQKLRDIYVWFKNIIEILKPYILEFLVFIGYLSDCLENLLVQIETLEQQRAT